MTGIFKPAPATPMFRFRFFALLITATAMTAASARDALAALPVAGDTYVYRIINGYNKEQRGQINYRVEPSDADRIVVAVTTDRAGVQLTTTEIYTPDGKWLHHPLSNHDRSIDYEFTPAYPSYEFPLERGKQWSTRVSALNPATGARRSVRVDATVSGTERVRVAAGEFDTIKISRSVYAGDADFPLTETTIIETEWYAPSLGRSVRLNSTSSWIDRSAHEFRLTHGDWDILELMSASAPQAR